MRHRPFPTEDDLASLDEEALKAAAEVSDEDKDQEWIGEIELSQFHAFPDFLLQILHKVRWRYSQNPSNNSFHQL